MRTRSRFAAAGAAVESLPAKACASGTSANTSSAASKRTLPARTAGLLDDDGAPHVGGVDRAHVRVTAALRERTRKPAARLGARAPPARSAWHFSEPHVVVELAPPRPGHLA